MKTTEATFNHQAQPRRLNPLPLLATFLLGAVLTALWFHRPTASPAPVMAVELSERTQQALASLPAPVTIHYYSLLHGNEDTQLDFFAGRTGRLLNAMREASGGKLEIDVVDAPAEANATAAGAEGIQAFNLEKGAANFLGATIASGQHKETMARLDPAYEAALESDFVRAILRVAIPPATAPPMAEVAKPSNDLVASIHRLIPDVAATSADAANQIFQSEFMKEFSEAQAEIDTQIQAAQQRVEALATNGSPAEFEAAQKNLAKVQLAQSDKIRKIAAELRVRQEVFKGMKDGGTSAGK